MKGQDLPLASRRDIVATGEARHHEAALRRGVALPDNVLISRHSSGTDRQAQQGGLLLRRERGDALQLAD